MALDHGAHEEQGSPTEKSVLSRQVPESFIGLFKLVSAQEIKGLK